MFRYLVAFALAFALSALSTLGVRALAARHGLIARPRADRWHSRPTALFGGVGIYLGLIAACAILGVIGPALAGAPRLLSLERIDTASLLLCATAMFILGLADDRLHLAPHTKLTFQIIICALFTRFGLRLHWLPSEVLDQALTLFWLVGITNALNLLDNIDGLAGGVAAIGALFLVYLCHESGHHGHAVLAAAFAGAACGFLLYNFNPASIFMGDCGSLLLGFFLAGLSLDSTQPGGRRNLMAVLTVPVLILLLPIMDTTLVTISRKLAGRSIATGGRDHTSHRLVALGLSERRATLTLWVLSGSSGLMAVLVRSLEVRSAIGVVALFMMGLLFIMIFLGRVQVYEPVLERGSAKGMTLLPQLADFSYKRRVFEVAGDVVLILLSYYLAFLLRFDGELPEPFYGQLLRSLPVILCVQIGAFFLCGLYRGVWRYTGVSDVILQVRAVLLAISLSALVILMVFRFEGFSRAVFAIDGMLLLLCVGGSRLSFRLMRAWVARTRRVPDGRRVLIYGAGDRGELVVQELIHNRRLGMVPVGFLDDDPHKHGRIIHGVRVLGALGELGHLISEEKISCVVVSTGQLPAARMDELRALCAQGGATLHQMRIQLE